MTAPHYLRNVIPTHKPKVFESGDTLLSFLYWSNLIDNKLFCDIRCYQDETGLKRLAGHFYVSYDNWKDDIMAVWEFVEIKLDKEDKKPLAEYMKELNDDPVEMLTAISALGYKVSVSWVDKQNSFVVSVSGRKDTKYNNGLSVSSWSDNLIEAIGMAAYKVIKLTDSGDWKEHATESSNWG